MLILIEKDAATRIPKECTPEQAEAFATDFTVFVVNDDASTTPYAEWKEAQAPVDAPADPEAPVTPVVPDVPVDAPEAQA